MNWLELKEMLITSTTTEDYNITDNQYYTWLSLAHTKIAESIKTKVDSKYFFRWFDTDTVIWQSAYNLLPVSLVDAIYIKYTEDWEYIKATPRDVTELDYDLDYYRKNQDETDPFYLISDQLIHIFPTANNYDIQRWLKVLWKTSVWKIVDSTIEWQVFLWELLDYHDMIVEYAKRYVYEYIKDRTWKWDSIVEYDRMFDRMISEISYRWSNPITYKEANLDYLLN